jgi:D-alanyl-D-alanine endopeptidase (penicillin-binding protein 7)
MSPVIQMVGWAMIHFVWQASAVAVATAAAMRLCRRPNSRYLVACLGLAGMLAAPIATLALLTSSSQRAPTLFIAAWPDGDQRDWSTAASA